MKPQIILLSFKKKDKLLAFFWGFSSANDGSFLLSSQILYHFFQIFTCDDGLRCKILLLKKGHT